MRTPKLVRAPPPPLATLVQQNECQVANRQDNHSKEPPPERLGTGTTPFTPPPLAQSQDIACPPAPSGRADWCLISRTSTMIHLPAMVQHVEPRMQLSPTGGDSPPGAAAAAAANCAPRRPSTRKTNDSP